MRRLALIVLTALATSAQAPPPGTCSDWVAQTDGTAWRMCTDVQRQIYCELKDGGTITRMVCPD